VVFVSAALSSAGFLLLAIAGVQHVRRYGEFRRLVAGHGLIPASLIGLGVLVLVVVELAIGIGGLVANAVAVMDGSVLPRGLMASSAVVFLLFAGYSGELVRRRSPSGCGCGPLDRAPVSGYVPVRALILAAMATVSAVTAPSSVTPLLPADLVVLLLASLSMALLLAVFAEVMQPPERHVPGMGDR
jgi:hypothetical protein